MSYYSTNGIVLFQCLRSTPLRTLHRQALRLNCPSMRNWMWDWVLEQGTGWMSTLVMHRQSLPMTPTLFHEGTGLFIASVAIARRLVKQMPFGPIFPNVYILQVGQSTVWRKTTGRNIGFHLCLEVFPELLTPQVTTPEALLSDMAGNEPVNYQQMVIQEKELWQKRAQFLCPAFLVPG